MKWNEFIKYIASVYDVNRIDEENYIISHGTRSIRMSYERMINLKDFTEFFNQMKPNSFAVYKPPKHVGSDDYNNEISMPKKYDDIFASNNKSEKVTRNKDLFQVDKILKIDDPDKYYDRGMLFAPDDPIFQKEYKESSEDSEPDVPFGAKYDPTSPFDKRGSNIKKPNPDHFKKP
ncbi:hypothetical protein TCON_1271 [Astathelohania contejeani]|uniref:PI31 proteasome regulator C-terminal domain-containing protein n=1 Tax=Astathelohania contejeani TaxID=164912 RepID=A0ABQ7HZH2_9MICR|nr:hypothetical protein TCON_1271 [Thelohania contejeani]